MRVRSGLSPLLALGLLLNAQPLMAAAPRGDSGDICVIRPDLCDGPKRAQGVSRAPAAAQHFCFRAGADPRLNTKHLPNCRATRVPASLQTEKVDFASYLQSNATNPALLRHGIEQSAFKDTGPAPILILPNIDGSTDGASGAAPAGTAAPAAGSPSGVTASPGGASGSAPPEPGSGAK